MSERYNLLINADRSIIEHSHGANYTTKFQEQVRKKLLNKCFLEIFLAEPGKHYIPIDLTQFQEDIFEKFKKNPNIHLLSYSGIDWNKKANQESDEYKDEILKLVKEGKTNILGYFGFGIDWNKKDGQESDFYKNEILRIIESRKLSFSLEIDWNKKANQESDEYKDKILKLVEDEKIVSISDLGIDWNKKGGQESDYYKDKILRLFKEGRINSLFGIRIDWNKKDGQESEYYKDEILRLFEEGKIDSLLGLEIDWNKKDGQESDYYKNRILKLFEEGKIPSDEFVDFKIDWNKKDGQESDEYKDKFIEFVKSERIPFFEFAVLEINWNRKNCQESDEYKNEIFRFLLKEEGISNIFFDKFRIDWNRKDGQESDYYISRLLDVYYKTIPEFREIIDRVQQSYNPLEEIGLYKQLFFESGPHWKLVEDEKVKSVVSGENADTIKDSLESQYESKKRFLKSLLVGLYDMGTLQILAESENQKIKKLTGSQMDTYPEGDRLKDVSFVDRLSPKELNVYLLFYINKMTKLNELTIYRRMLGSFTYDEELEAGLRKNRAKIESAEKNNTQTPSPEIQKLLEYKREKAAAEDRADYLIAVFNELKAKYDDIVANNMSEKVGQRFPLYMESFTSFLQHYWETKDNPDSKQLDGKTVNGKLLEFFEFFNSRVDELQRRRN